jgi:phospholipase C
MGSTPDPDNLEVGGNDAGAVRGDTIFDVLSESGISWNYVESNIAFLRMFDKYRVDEENIVQFADWRAKAVAGRLPAVSWVDPNFGDLEIDGNANDDHPPANVLKGQAIVRSVYEALTSNAAQWSKTLFIITYDEHGGFYDHVVPHGLNDEDADPPVHKIHEEGQDFYGLRVPAFIVSPWVGRRKCSSVVLDHTSILKTILLNFLGEGSIGEELLGKRVDAANNLLDLLEDEARSDIPAIAEPPEGEDAQNLSFPIERGSFHLGMRLFGLGSTLKRLVAQRADQ